MDLKKRVVATSEEKLVSSLLKIWADPISYTYGETVTKVMFDVLQKVNERKLVVRLTGSLRLLKKMFHIYDFYVNWV